MKTVKALLGDQVVESKRCCGESGGLAYSRPDVSTQIRFRKEEEILAGEAEMRDKGWVDPKENTKVLTSCPSCLIGLNRFQDDLQNGLLEADYIVVEMAKKFWVTTGCPSMCKSLTMAASNAYWYKHGRTAIHHPSANRHRVAWRF